MAPVRLREPTRDDTRGGISLTVCCAQASLGNSK